MLFHKRMDEPILRLGNNFYKIGFSIRAKNKYDADTSYVTNYWLWKYLENTPKLETGREVIDRDWDARKWSYDPDWVDSFSEEFRTKNINIGIGTFFQSFKWFDEYSSDMLEFFRFKQQYIDEVQQKYKEVFTKKTIGISIRRGDFVNHGVFYQIPLEWYEQALYSEFPNWQDYNIVFFSDNINELKSIFKGDNYFFAEHNDTYKKDAKNYHADAHEQFIFGTMMDNYIISQSTFSMAIAYLGYRQRGGKVVHSGQNLTDSHCTKVNIDQSDYYPEYWTHYPCVT